jgi:hypothetical protein
MQHTQFVQALERQADRCSAVFDVIGIAHGVHASEGEHLRRLQRGVKAVVLRGVFIVGA